MTTLATLLVRLGLDSAGYKQGMTEVAESTKRQTVNLGGLIAKIASLPGAAMAFHLLAGGVHELGDALIGGNAQFETYQTQFAALLHSADAAKTLIGDLANFAAVTPFELPEVIQGSKNLLTFGGAALNTMENLKIFGNAAAATSSDFGEVTFAVGRAYAAIQAGKPFGESTQRLMELGVMGSATALKLEKLQQIKAPPEAVWEAFRNGLQAPADAMDKLSQTWSGLISTLHDTLAGLGRTIGAPIFTAAKSILLPLLNFLMGPVVQGAAQALANGIGKALTLIGKGFRALIPLVRPIFTFISEGFVLIRDAVITFGEALAGHWLPDRESIRPFHEAIGELALLVRDVAIPAFERIRDVWNTVSGPLGTVVDVVARFLLLGSPFVRMLYDIFTNWSAVADGIKNGGLVGGVNAFLDALDRLGPMDEVIAGVLRSLGSLAVTIVSIGSALASGDFSGAWDAFAAGLGALWTILSDTASNIGAMLQPIIDGIVTWIETNAPLIGTQLLTWATEFANWVPTAITTALDALPGLIDSLLTWIGDQVQPIIDKASAWASAFVDWIGPAIPGFLEAVGAFATGIGTAIVNGIPAIVEQTAKWAAALVDWITTTAVPALTPAFDTFMENLRAGAERASTVLNSAGNRAGQSMVEGLKLGWANAPVAVSDEMIVMAGAIDRNRPLFIALMKVLGEESIKSFTDNMLATIPVRLPSIETLIEGTLIGWIPLLGIQAGKLGLSIAESWYKGAYDQFQKLFPGLNALGASMGRLLADGLNTAGALIVTAAQAIGRRLMEGIAQGFGDLAGWVAGKVTAALGGAITLIRIGQRIQSPSKVWAEQIGKPLADGIAAGAADNAGKMANSVASSVGGALDSAKGKLSGKATSLVKSVGSELLDTANKVIDLVGKAADVFGKLDSFKAPGAGILSSLFGAVGDTLTQAGTLSGRFKAKAVEAAGNFSDSASKILNLVGTGADNLKKLIDFVAPSSESIRTFFTAAESAITDAVVLARRFAPKALEAAATFAEGAGKVLSLVDTGATAFQGLAKFRAPTIESLSDFFTAVMWAVNDMVGVIRTVTPKLMTLAGEFADSAGSVLKLVHDGADAFAGLEDWKAPTIDSLSSFFTAVMWAVNDAVTVANNITLKTTELAAAFADGAGKVVGLIGGAVTAFASLKKFQAPTIDVLSEFFTAVYQAVNNALAASHGIDQDLLDAAVAWADGAGKILGIISGAVDALMSVRKYKGILPEQFRLLANDINGVVATMVEIAKTYKSEFLDAATQFAETTGAVMNAIKTSLDVLTSLGAYKGVAPAAVNLLISDLYGVIGTFQGFFNTIGDALANADVWRSTMEDLAGTVKAAVEAVTSFADYKGKIPEQGSFLLSDMQYLNDVVITMASLAAVTAQNMLTWQLLIQDTVKRVRAGAATIQALDGLNIDATVTMGIHTRVRSYEPGGTGGGPSFSAGGDGGNYGGGDTPPGSNTFYEIHMNGPVHDKADARDGLVDALRAAGVNVNG